MVGKGVGSTQPKPPGCLACVRRHCDPCGRRPKWKRSRKSCGTTSRPSSDLHRPRSPEGVPVKRRTSVAYTDVLPYAGNRAYASVQLVNGIARSSAFVCLVDTGADYLLLPSSAAVSVGIALPVSTIAIATVCASINVHRVTGCAVEIEGIPLPQGATTLFDPTGGLPLILGRQALLAFCECGFNTTEWVWR